MSDIYVSFETEISRITALAKTFGYRFAFLCKAERWVSGYSVPEDYSKALKHAQHDILDTKAVDTDTLYEKMQKLEELYLETLFLILPEIAEKQPDDFAKWGKDIMQLVLNATKDNALNDDNGEMSGQPETNAAAKATH